MLTEDSSYELSHFKGGLPVQVGAWTFLWDKSIEQHMLKYRSEMLPNETGGILLGFIDYKIKTICVVLATNAPGDSISSPHEFMRGMADLKDNLDECYNKTANVVSYIGEWHSHPNSYSATPSSSDKTQLKYLSDVMGREGLPGIMVIISEQNISVSIDDITEMKSY
ncbi:Mov34/MPN/PAD-1 family protein [Piscirickettsia salmonis]|uniref:Mov34/MPN/PAD-1 family protein n=2 Tax=Piscirickettsia salmonis TaxID=1238 RepID=UPI0018ACB4DE|nr:Mov34/MPN/PAD-1 family protein [Piscirickettsia salmonis]